MVLSWHEKTKMMNTANNSIPQKELRFDLDKNTLGHAEEFLGKLKNY